MAFNKENYYQDGNSEEYFFKRNNPLANGANAEILKVESCGSCEIELNVFLFTTRNPFTGASSTEVTFGAPTTGYTDLSASTIQITDGEGGFAYGAGDSVIDTTALNHNVLWTVTIYIARGEDSVLGCLCSKTFVFKHDGTSSIPTTIDTDSMGLGVLRAYQNGGNTPYSTLELAAAAGSPDITFSFDIANVSGNVLQIESFAFTGDISDANYQSPLQYGVGTLYADGTKRDMTVTFTGVAFAGSYSGTIVFTFADATTQTITFNLTVS